MYNIIKYKEMLSDKTERKFIDTIDLDEWEIETDTGWEDVSSIGKTIPYEKWVIETDFYKLECADTHIVYTEYFNEVYIKDLNIGDKIMTSNGPQKIINIINTHIFEEMYDLNINSKNHRYYTNGILSHNSIWLANLAGNAVRLGYNSAVISLEMRDRHVVKRLGANLLGITMSEYATLADDQDLIRKKIGIVGMEDLKTPGKLWVKEYPTSSASVKDLERYLIKMEQLKGVKFKCIFVDYINILANWRNPNSENTYMKIKQIAEDLRGMATKNNWAVITVTQLNRCLTLDTEIETRFGIIKLKDATIGLDILTPDGFAPITKIYPVEKQKVYKIITKSGKELKVSSQHLTPKSNGDLCTINELHVGDKILCKSK